jgi:O-antigen ligase
VARFSEHARPRTSASTGAIVTGTLLLIAWGAFAFGAVYPWAYTPLAIGCAGIGIIGLFAGQRSFDAVRRVFFALTAFGVLTLLQLLPVPMSWLALVNPGTVGFLRRYDLAFSLTGGDAVPGAGEATTHAISIAPALTFRGFLLFLAFSVFLVGLCRALSRTSATRLASGIVLLGCALGLFGIAQKILLGSHVFAGMRIYGFWRPESLLTTPFGPFVNKNHFAGWMLMAWPLALCLAAASLQESGTHRRGLAGLLIWLSSPEGGRVSVYVLSALVMGVSLMMTGSRSGLIGMLIVVAGVLRVARRSLSTKTMVAAALATVALLLAMLQWTGQDAAVERFVNDSSSLSMRLGIWRASLGLIAQAPAFGTGLDSFGTAMIMADPDAATVHYAEAHNEYIQLLVETGALGLFVVGTAAVLAGSVIRQRFIAADDGVEMTWTRRGATIGLVAIAVQSLVEFSLQMPGNAALFVTLLAIALFRPAAIRRVPTPTGPLV